MNKEELVAQVRSDLPHHQHMVLKHYSPLGPSYREHIISMEDALDLIHQQGANASKLEFFPSSGFRLTTFIPEVNGHDVVSAHVEDIKHAKCPNCKIPNQFVWKQYQDPHQKKTHQLTHMLNTCCLKVFSAKELFETIYKSSNDVSLVKSFMIENSVLDAKKANSLSNAQVITMAYKYANHQKISDLPFSTISIEHVSSEDGKHNFLGFPKK